MMAQYRLIDLIYWLRDLVWFWIFLIGGIKVFDLLLVYFIAPFIKKRL